jgi:wobble nucleotide-excising tRNase
MSKRKLLGLAVWTLVVSLILSLALTSEDLLSNESTKFKLLMLLGTLVVMVLIVGPALYGFRQQQERNAELNRTVDEQNKRREEAEERRRIYEENYQREGRVLKDCILADLRAIARGEKVRFGGEALDAAKALQMRQGDHPETWAAWAPLLEDLRAASLDPKAIQTRLDDLLYPETLEDVQTLKKRVMDDLERVSRGEKTRLDPEALDAAKSLNDMQAREARIRREEDESEAQARCLEEASNRTFSAAMDEMARASVRNILRMHGLSETTLDGLPLHEALKHIRALRLSRELESKPDQAGSPDS